MAVTDYETKLNSKGYRFFDFLYRLILLNVITLLTSLTIVCLLPGVCACLATMKEGPTGVNLFKQWWLNFKKYFKKSFFTGLILIVLYGIIIYALYFYLNSTSDVDFTNIFINAGFMVNLVAFIIVLFLTGHLPFLLITFPKFTVGQVLKTSFYMTFRYFLTSLINLIMNIIIIGGLIVCIIWYAVLAVWLLIGITLPLLVELRVTKPVYYKLEKIDFEKLYDQIDEEIEEEERNKHHE